MGGDSGFKLFAVLLICFSLLQTNTLSAELVNVRRMEGLSHGFLALRTMEGKLLADGEITQVAKGDRVTSRLLFRFKKLSLSLSGLTKVDGELEVGTFFIGVPANGDLSHDL